MTRSARPIIPLTSTQQALAESCIPLAFKEAQRWFSTFGDDAFSMACVSLCHAAREFDPARGLAFTTLATVSIRRAFCQEFDYTRCRRHAGDHAETYDSDKTERMVSPSLEHDVDLLEYLRQRVRLLPPRLRQAIRLYYFRGLKMIQVGERMGVSVERARQLINKGKRNLRRELLPMARRHGFIEGEVAG